MHIQKLAPKFIGIGGKGTGLGLITQLIEAHPQVTGPLLPRRFFNTDDYDEKGVAHYVAQLGLGTAIPCSGEVCLEYLTSSNVPERIAKTFPDAKLFAMVRNPIDRGIVEYRHALATKQIPKSVSCAQFLTNYPHTQTDGFYGRHLRPYTAFYSSLQLHIMVYEDFAREPLVFTQKLYEFLELDATFIPKSLLMFAPLPEEPKHRGRISRLIRFCGKTIKKLHPKKPDVSIIPPAIAQTDYLHDTELALFKNTFAADAAQLSYFIHRDMVVEWGLGEKEVIK
jgi:Sulfotransferase family